MQERARVCCVPHAGGWRIMVGDMPVGGRVYDKVQAEWLVGWLREALPEINNALDVMSVRDIDTGELSLV